MDKSKVARFLAHPAGINE